MEQLCLCSHPGHSVRQREGRPRWPRTITRRSATRCASSAPAFRAPTGASATSEREYPQAFVEALGEAGYLACLIPEAYGGSGLGLTAAAAILEEIHASGGNGAACHAQMYTMGALLRHGSEAQKERWLPGIARGQLRLQAFGVTEPGAGSDTTGIATTAMPRGRPLRRHRAEDLDQPGRAFRPHAAAGADHAPRAGGTPERRAFPVPGRPARGRWPDDPADPDDAQPRHHRGLPRPGARCRPGT